MCKKRSSNQLLDENRLRHAPRVRFYFLGFELSLATFSNLHVVLARIHLRSMLVYKLKNQKVAFFTVCYFFQFLILINYFGAVFTILHHLLGLDFIYASCLEVQVAISFLFHLISAFSTRNRCTPLEWRYRLVQVFFPC